MQLQIESKNLEDYLKEVPPIIQFDTPAIQKQIKAITAQTSSPKKQAEIAFKIARDQIQHSFDKEQCEIVTISAEETLEKKEGICFAKSHLLATLLRGLGIPTGFCYQLKNNPKAGYVLHGLNAIYFEDTGWFRVDPRGNKPGIDAQFSIEKEQLAYFIDPSKGEIDYPNVFVEPLPIVINAMKDSKDVEDLFFKRPDSIENA